jgi:putative peptidoglycan lipid II flippase
MTRPTRPPGPPYPDGEEPGPEQPRFTPRQPAQHPPAQGSPAQGSPAQGSYPYDPPLPPPPPSGRPQPTFTPHADGRDVRPRPTFTPREGNVPPGGRSRPAPAPTAFFSPAPAGYPQPSFEPFEYAQPGSVPAPRFVPGEDRQDRTRVLERESVPTGPQRVAETTGPNLARSSKAMALGTIASRLTGFLRTFVFVVAIGSGSLAEAYNNSNNLPNTVYYLMLGGIFTSVVVPLLVRAAKEDPDRGEAYAERIFTVGVVALLSVTVVATVLAGPIVDLFAGNIRDPGEHAVMVTFAYFFIPQIFFYGMDSLLGAILNTRGRFGANMWTPVINNVVVILVGGLYIVTIGLNKTADNVPHGSEISSGGIHLLAVGTTLGIVIQSICLFPVMRRAGFSMRLRWDLRRAEIAEIGAMAGWMFGYVVTQSLGNLVAQRVANAASNSAAHLAHPVTGVGYAAYSYGWQLFQLPYAIVGISVISALMPRMSGHATDRRYSLVRDDFSKGVRLASVIVVPSAVFLAVLGPALCQFLFGYGSETWQEARFIGEVFGVFALGLVPFMLTQLQLRVFYSFQETRTPAIVGMVMLIVGVIGDLIALEALPPTRTVIGLAFAYNMVTLTGAVISWPLLLRRVGSLDGWRITRSLVRMLLATLPGLAFAFVVMAVVGSFLHHGPVYGFVTTVVGGGGALLLYAFCCRILGIEEFRTLMRSVAGRFG